MSRAAGFGNHMRHPHVQHQHGGQNADVDLLANTDAYRTAVLNADFGQSLFAQIIYHKGIVSIFANSLDLLLIAVNGNYLFAGFGKGAGQRRTKAPQPDNAEQSGRILFFHNAPIQS